MLALPVVLPKSANSTVGRVVVAGCVAIQRLRAGGRVVAAGCVATERYITSGRIEAAGCVKKKR